MSVCFFASCSPSDQTAATPFPLQHRQISSDRGDRGNKLSQQGQKQRKVPRINGWSKRAVFCYVKMMMLNNDVWDKMTLNSYQGRKFLEEKRAGKLIHTFHVLYIALMIQHGHPVHPTFN